MPVRWLRAYARMLTRIEEDDLRALALVTSRSVAWAFGTLSNRAAAEFQAWIEGDATRGKPQSVSPIIAAQRTGIPIMRGNGPGEPNDGK